MTNYTLESVKFKKNLDENQVGGPEFGTTTMQYPMNQESHCVTSVLNWHTVLFASICPMQP